MGWPARARKIGILITPWGEALIHRYYRRAMSALSQMKNVYRITIQTNLSGRFDEFENANRDTISLWATFHPSETTLAEFVSQCERLDAIGIRHSVGVVGLREHFEQIEQLRRALPVKTYIWINACKRNPNYYQADEIDRLTKVDPYFPLNNRRYPSANFPCEAGETSFTVDALGDMRRCHFIDRVIGNIYSSDFESALESRLCTVPTCGCYIGYIHRPDLNLKAIYGAGLLDRIPQDWNGSAQVVATV